MPQELSPERLNELYGKGKEGVKRHLDDEQKKILVGLSKLELAQGATVLKSDWPRPFSPTTLLTRYRRDNPYGMAALFEGKRYYGRTTEDGWYIIRIQ